MSDKKLSVLGIIAVIMAGLAILQSRINQRVNVVDFSSSALMVSVEDWIESSVIWIKTACSLSKPRYLSFI